MPLAIRPSLIKNGHWIFNMSNDLSVCCIQEGKMHTYECTSVDMEELKKRFLEELKNGPSPCQCHTQGSNS